MENENILNIDEVNNIRTSLVSKGEAPFLTFNDNGKNIGELWVKNGQLVFKGDVEESAKVFFDHVIQLNRRFLEETSET